MDLYSIVLCTARTVASHDQAHHCSDPQWWEKLLASQGIPCQDEQVLLWVCVEACLQQEVHLLGLQPAQNVDGLVSAQPSEGLPLTIQMHLTRWIWADNTCTAMQRTSAMWKILCVLCYCAVPASGMHTLAAVRFQLQAWQCATARGSRTGPLLTP